MILPPSMQHCDVKFVGLHPEFDPTNKAHTEMGVGGAMNRPFELPTMHVPPLVTPWRYSTSSPPESHHACNPEAVKPTA